jgi:hypothetical protein
MSRTLHRPQRTGAYQYCWPWYSSPSSDLRITRVFPCITRRTKACASFMFAGCSGQRLLAVDGGSGARARNAKAKSSVGRPGAPLCHNQGGSLAMGSVTEWRMPWLCT